MSHKLSSSQIRERARKDYEKSIRELRAKVAELNDENIQLRLKLNEAEETKKKALAELVHLKMFTKMSDSDKHYLDLIDMAVFKAPNMYSPHITSAVEELSSALTKLCSKE